MMPEAGRYRNGHRVASPSRTLAWETAASRWFRSATVTDSCCTVIPGVTIPPQLIRVAEAVPVPLPRGGVLLMHRLMHHGPLPNHSGHGSLELRSALQPRRPAERPRGAAGLHCTQPRAAGHRDPRPRRVDRALAPDPCHPGRAARSRLRNAGPPMSRDAP